MAPVSHSTWGLRGHTPRITHATTRIRYSALGAIVAGGKGKRPRFYFRIYPHNIRSEQVIKFIDHLLFMIPGHIVLVWDNLPTHRAKVVKEFAANYPRLHIEKLPPYAPELNPVENAWSQMKYHELGNFTPATPDELYRAAQDAAQNIRWSPKKCSSFLRSIPLKWSEDKYFFT